MPQNADKTFPIHFPCPFQLVRLDLNPTLALLYADVIPSSLQICISKFHLYDGKLFAGMSFPSISFPFIAFPSLSTVTPPTKVQHEHEGERKWDTDHGPPPRMRMTLS